MYFLAKVRIDSRKLAELSRALQDGTLDRGRLKATHCLANDPAVGFALWEADDRAHFDAIFAPHATFYAEVLEVNQVITPPEAMAALLAMSSAEHRTDERQL